MDDFVRDKLTQWGLREWIKTFKDQGVDRKNIFCLKDQHIIELIPKVGPRAQFEQGLERLKAERNTNQEKDRVFSQVLPSTSNEGKRKVDIQTEFSKVQPPAKRHHRSLSRSTSVAEEKTLSDVKETMKNVLTKLQNQDNTILNAFLKKKIGDLETDVRELVGVFGKTGAGKSSLINAVVGVTNLLPSGCVNACTSVMIKVEANMTNQKYEADIEFITKEEWKDELWGMNQIHLDNVDQERGDTDIVEKLSAIYGAEWEQKSPEDLMNSKYFREIPEFLQSLRKTLTCETAIELSGKLVKYTKNDAKQGQGNDAKRWYWPVVKCVTVRVPKNDFLQHVTLVDLPGNGDRNKSRDTMWKGIVGNCSTVWIVAEINRAASEQESWEILQSAASLLGNGGECRHIQFICTKSDIFEDFQEHSADVIQALILKRNIEVKESVKNEFRKLPNIRKHFSDDCFKVFTVSSKEFLNGRYLSPQNSEIPKLQDFLQNLNDCHSETLNYVSGARGILSLIQGASLKNVAGKKYVCEDLENNLNRKITETKLSLGGTSAAFKECLNEGVKKSTSSCDKMLSSFLFPRGKVNYHMTLKSVVTNGGVHKPKRGKQINLNMKLSSLLADSIDEKFRKIFPNETKCGSFRGVIDEFSLDTERLKLKYKDVALQLTFLKTEEEKIKTQLSTMIRDRKKKIYSSLTETIEKNMVECYTEAAAFRGKGMLENMRETIQKHVHQSKNIMFEEAKDVMMAKLRSLMVDMLRILENTMKETIELSLKTEDHSIPDVTMELKMVQNAYGKLKTISKAEKYKGL